MGRGVSCVCVWGGGVATLTGQECLQRCAVLVPSQDTQQIVSLVLVLPFFFLQSRQRICCFLFDLVRLIRRTWLFAPIARMFILMVITMVLRPEAAGITSCLCSHYEFTPPDEAASQTILNL